MQCIGCEGRGCDECRDKGTIAIECCPLVMITRDIWELITLAELFEKGLPPVAGGVLNQAKIFVEAARLIFNEQQYYKRKLGITE